MARRAAFFDVDTTLITGTSLFEFLAHDLAERGFDAWAYHDAMAGLARRKAAGASREECNRAFLAQFAGRSVVELTRTGRRWFAERHARGGLFHPPVLDRLRAHAHAGELVVLLSGSFPPCVAPIAEHVGAHVAVCTEPEQAGGRYTGTVHQPMVGAHKAKAVRDLARWHDLDLARCHAYGDDVSDLPALTAVGRPVVVGEDPVLTEHADRHGWTRLPAADESPSPPSPTRSRGPVG